MTLECFFKLNRGRRGTREGGRSRWSLVPHSDVMILLYNWKPREGLSRGQEVWMGYVHVSVFVCVWGLSDMNCALNTPCFMESGLSRVRSSRQQRAISAVPPSCLCSAILTTSQMGYVLQEWNLNTLTDRLEGWLSLRIWVWSLVPT